MSGRRSGWTPGAPLKELKLRSAAELVEQKVAEMLLYYAFPSTHWRQIRTNNPLERITRAIRRRTRMVGAFPDSARRDCDTSRRPSG
jgi:transposase-like protein